MLVLTRRIGERIIIGDQVVVEVLEARGNRIRLGIQAPPGVSILRQELLPQPLEVEIKQHDSSLGDYAGAR